MIFRQLLDLESSTYSYILADSKSKDAILIDPVLEQVERDAALIRELKLNLLFILETHIHADHITGSARLKELFPQSKSVVGSGAEVNCADQKLSDGETLRFGSYTLKAIATPGHTDSCTTYHVEDRIFTGDTLLIRGCGRTDFQQGSSERLFESVRTKLFSLPDETKIFPAHDYKGMMMTTVGEEKEFNPRLNLKVSKESFIKIMADLKLTQPKKIHEAVPANLQCGRLSA